MRIASVALSTLILVAVVSPVCGDSSTQHVSAVEIDTYFVLGMLEEYISRNFVEGSDLVEDFYWGEELHGYVMAAYLKRMSRELGLPDDIRIGRIQELMVALHSKPMSDYINCFYDYQLTRSTLALHDGEWRRTAQANLDHSSFEGKSDTLKYAYLAGAYFRFGENDRFTLTNGTKKADLISRLLKDIGCPVPTISVKRNGAPSTVFLDFNPTKLLTDWFARYPEDWVFEAVDSLAGTASKDELEIYRCVISALQRGTIGECRLSVPCIVPRLNFIFGDGDSHIPGLSPEWQEVLDDHNARRTEFTSLIGLACDSILVRNVASADENLWRLNLTRIGFNETRLAAIAIIPYGCKRTGRLAVLLDKRDDRWRITCFLTRNIGKVWE